MTTTNHDKSVLTVRLDMHMVRYLTEKESKTNMTRREIGGQETTIRQIGEPTDKYKTNMCADRPVEDM